MKFNKITSALLSLNFLACTYITLPANAESNSWKEAYLSVVQSKVSIEDIKFSLERIDDDNIPELVVYSYDDNSQLAIYSYSEDGLTTIAENIEKTQHMGCNKEENTIVTRYYGGDSHLNQYRITRIENGKPEILYDFGYYDSDDGRVFFFNGEQYDYSEYSELVYGTYSKGLDDYYGKDYYRFYPYDVTVGHLTGETSGTHENISWNLSDDGVLTITGEGKMPDFRLKSIGVGGNEITSVEFYEDKTCPWFAVRNLVQKIDIDKRITYIGNMAFASCDYVAEIDLHDNITEIGERAFMDCDLLKNAVIPSSVVRIAPEAFAYCQNITEVVIPENVAVINYEAFNRIYSLENILIMNKDCEISMHGDTISNLWDTSAVDYASFEGLILGKAGSTAQTYAETYGRNFREAQYGDVNLDSFVDASDCSALLAEYAKTATNNPSEFTCIQKYLGNVNKDTTIDASDASSVLAYYAYIATGGTDSIEDFLS